MILDYLVTLHAIACILVREAEEKAVWPQRQRLELWGHKPRNASSHQSW